MGTKALVSLRVGPKGEPQGAARVLEDLGVDTISQIFARLDAQEVRCKQTTADQFADVLCSTWKGAYFC